MQLAQRKSREVRSALLARNVFIFPSEMQRPGQVPFWESSFEGEYARGVLFGDWKLHGRWRYWSDPNSGEAVLQESSVGVTVESHGQAGLPDSVCIARYDVELYGRSRGRHVNVYQPVINDSVHWIYLDPTAQFDDWSFGHLLGFFIDHLPDELLAAGWPPR
jgi:hypothetical protein